MCSKRVVRHYFYLLVPIFVVLANILGRNVQALTSDRRSPNVLLIVMDTARHDRLSCYGYHRDTTPNIDKIGKEGVVYENAISAAIWTLPSHASIFTGMYLSKHGVTGEHKYLDDRFDTIAEVLKSQGYRTAAFSNNPYVAKWSNLTQGFDMFWQLKRSKNWWKIEDLNKEELERLKRNLKDRFTSFKMPKTKDAGAYISNLKIIEWLETEYDPEVPFFMFINYIEPHASYEPPGPYDTIYLDDGITAERVKEVTRKINWGRSWAGYITGKIKMRDRDFEILSSLYDGELAYLDMRMGELFDYLRQKDILDNTLLIITSDHGEHIGENKMMNHVFYIYDTLLHVPLVIRYPSSFPSGTRIRRQVQLTDIFPTILDVLGISFDGSDELQGYSLIPSKLDKHARPFAVAEKLVLPFALDILQKANASFDISPYLCRRKTIRTEDFKYIWSSDDSEELYNIKNGSGELNNIIESHPQKAEQLRQKLQDWLSSFEHYKAVGDEPVSEVDKETLERLKDLGYVQ